MIGGVFLRAPVMVLSVAGLLVFAAPSRASEDGSAILPNCVVDDALDQAVAAALSARSRIDCTFAAQQDIEAERKHLIFGLAPGSPQPTDLVSRSSAVAAIHLTPVGDGGIGRTVSRSIDDQRTAGEFSPR